MKVQKANLNIEAHGKKTRSNQVKRFEKIVFMTL